MTPNTKLKITVTIKFIVYVHYLPTLPRRKNKLPALGESCVTFRCIVAAATELSPPSSVILDSLLKINVLLGSKTNKKLC